MLPTSEVSSPWASASSSPPGTPSQGTSIFSAFSTPATSCFDPATSPRYLPAQTSKKLIPVAPPLHVEESSIRIQRWRETNVGSRNKAESSEHGSRHRSASQAMFGQPSLHTFEIFDQLKLGCLIGSGQWSNVYAATWKEFEPVSDILSDCECSSDVWDNLNPINDSTITSQHIVSTQSESRNIFAVKIGSGKSSVKVLRNESRILTFLVEQPFINQHVVEFYGYNIEGNALIMENVPLTMEIFVRDIHTKQVSVESTEVRRNIMNMLQELVKGLDYIHDADVVHGDIKPSNILLRQRKHSRDSGSGSVENRRVLNSRRRSGEDHDLGFRFQPVYCDFSASRFNHPQSTPSESAGTYDFMAPELFSRSKAESCPTCASDVYALGVTIIHMVTGKSPYAGAQNVFTRRAMAMLGTPLKFISIDDGSALRWERAGFTPWVSQAVLAEACHRWTAPAWREWVEKRYSAQD